MRTLARVDLLSSAPTLRYPRWRKQFPASGHLPTEAQLEDTLRWVGWQLLLFVALPVLAAMMARDIGH